MPDLVNLVSLDAELVDSIEKLLRIRESSHLYAKEPTEENAGLLAVSVNELSSQIENLRTTLSVMVKRVNGVDTEVVGRETDKGIQLP